MADETSDVGHHEHMSVVIRYFDDEACKPVEQFIGIQLIAVCFDGASAMSGKFNSVQAKVKEINPCAMYVHCYGHCLNLTLVDSLGNKNRIIFDFFGCVQLIYSFIEGSPTRHAVFEKIVQETNSKLKILKTLSTTRWACRAEAVTAVENNYSSVIQCLQEIANSTKYSEVRAKANGILYQMKSYNFIFALYMLKPILIQIQIVSAQLQAPNLDLLGAVSIVNALKKSLDDFCNGLENRFNQETLNIISSIGRLIQLKAEQFDIDLLSQTFSLNSDELEGEQSLLRSMPDFIPGTSTKTIYQWLETYQQVNIF
ncbi:zinc finger MYM-type protein 1-like [Acyrthosiphon pisum]|uniref:Uncharacterized protein n=1 Tax=Acyrthosiphon pisum TaxID=7029 RepID=A0A8R2B3U9_ACYPI|nr:zinc finger MYM-type protein 1-like [Acyrthosiphon pisum]|eukprot:XP_008178812.1 PREDICTED: zinc finger MYM-type protein 1-like [Acyrthosiphon pisum]